MLKLKRVVPQAHLYLPDGTDYWLTRVPAQEFLEKPVVSFSAIPNIPRKSNILLKRDLIATGLFSLVSREHYATKFPTDRMILVKGDFLIEKGSPHYPVLVEFSTRDEPETIPLKDDQIKEIYGVKTHARKAK